jgi:hypothetical protein
MWNRAVWVRRLHLLLIREVEELLGDLESLFE